MTTSTKKPKPIKQPRPSTIVISDWLANCQAGQWTPFEAATALKDALAKEGYAIVDAAVKKPDDGFGDYGVKIGGSPVISRTGSR